jgi:hypothetical protein
MPSDWQVRYTLDWSRPGHSCDEQTPQRSCRYSDVCLNSYSFYNLIRPHFVLLFAIARRFLRSEAAHR